jgi:aldehyde dehydrogenase (NAD+)
VVLAEALNSGRTTREVKDLDVAQVVKILYYYAGSCSFSDQLKSHEAVGVVAIASYWDSALLTLVSKLAASLAAGNTCVIIPHRLSPLSAFMLADICKQSGVPNGVINVITSDNDSIYKQISSHPLIDCVSFDGSINVKREISFKEN